MRVLIVVFMVMLVLPFVFGCSQQKSGEYTLTGNDLVRMAESGNVEGQIRGRLGGSAEFGLKEAFYMDTPDSSADFDIKFRFAKKDNITRVE